MIMMYGLAEGNARVAARLYAERFPERERHPNYNVILRCVQRTMETGNVIPNRQNVNALLHYGVDDEERILEEFEEHPQNSVRRAARILGFSRYVVHQTLRRNGLQPYHFQRVQHLLPRDREHRVYFCEGIFLLF